jgi:type I restriction enzyme S subunit
MKSKQKFRETEIGKIPEEWEVKTLDFISKQITDGSHFSPKASTNGTKIIATVKDMSYNSFEFENCKRISDSDYENLVRNGCSPEKGDILISKDGANCLDLIFVYQQEEMIVLLSSIAIIRLKPGYNPHFYRYYLLSPKAQGIMRNGYTSGSAMPRVILKDFKKVPVPLPPQWYQNFAGNLLYKMDKKIELNQQMSKNLETIGQVIFKKWFVDFEFPNELNKPYKSSGGEIVDSELGKIPKGWKAKSIDEIANFLNGLALQNYPPESEDKFLPVIKIKELRQGITDSSDKASVNIPDEYIVKAGDILFSWSGSLEVVIWTYGKGALNQHLFKVTSEKYPKWFYYYWIKQHLPEYRHIAEGKATTMGHIQRHHLKSSLVLVPDNETLLRMDKVLSPIFEKNIMVNIENRNLSQIRDSLLPKLVSGQIRVPIEVKK